MYGKGLCFGMAAAALLNFQAASSPRPPLADLPLTPDLLAVLWEYQLRQFYPRTVLASVRDWAVSGGGRPERVLGRLRPVGMSPDPHILCFGPAPNRRFVHCLARAHAVVPYRVEEGRVYVYDPNHPRDRGRFVEFRRDGAEFAYDGFRSREGWGITLVKAKLEARCVEDKPKRLVGDRAYDSDPLNAQLKAEATMIPPHRKGRKKLKTQDRRKLRRYKRRLRVERLFAWLGNFHRLVVRYERQAENYLGFVQLGCVRFSSGTCETDPCAYRPYSNSSSTPVHCSFIRHYSEYL